MKKGSVNFSALTGMGSSIRFSNPKDAENPGPGHYYPDSSSYRSQSHTLTEQRFSNFANYTSQHGTSHEIGPGAYHNDSVPYKRTFNASGELAEHKPWI